MAMTSIADQVRFVTVGVDTHRDVHVAGVIDDRGGELAAASFSADTAGYAALEAWAVGFGPVECFGVEGTGSWGRGLARHLTAAGRVVIEVNRPDRAQRRRAGKDDTLDAFAAARAAQSGQARAIPKTGVGPVEAIRVLRLARNGAVKARTQAANQLHALVATAPDALRGDLRDLTAKALARRCGRFRPAGPTDLRWSLRSVARRWLGLDAEAEALYTELKALTAATAPALMAMTGIGADVAAQLLITAGDNPDRLGSEAAFARLCGVAPIPASSGQTNKHRLHRGGDRGANAALHRAVIVRLRVDPETKTYMARRLAEGKTKKDAIRCLKRFFARRVHHELTKLGLDAI
jgi:transposase